MTAAVCTCAKGAKCGRCMGLHDEPSNELGAGLSLTGSSAVTASENPVARPLRCPGRVTRGHGVRIPCCLHRGHAGACR